MCARSREKTDRVKVHVKEMEKSKTSDLLLHSKSEIKSPQAARSSKCQDFGCPPWLFHLLPEEKRSKDSSSISVRRAVVE